MSQPLVLDRVRFGYTTDTPVLDDVSLEVGPGVTLVLGPNGAGKSTFLKLAAGVEHPDAGAIRIYGEDLWQQEVSARRHLAYVPEQPDITPYASVGSVLKFVCRLRNQPWSVAEALLQEFQLSNEANRSVRELSKGQRHRVLLAAARIGTPRLVLLDEPLSALDRGLRQRTVDWVREIRDAGGAVLIITHELEPFVELATRAIALKQGVARVVETLPTDLTQRLELLNQLAAG